jgi:hypothetical protein
MGEIVPALYRPARRVILIGQAPGSDGDTRPLTGTMGFKLAGLAGYTPVPDDEAVGRWWDRANVLDYYPGPADGKGHSFPTGYARIAAGAMWPRLTYDRVLFCGKAVLEAFRMAEWGDTDRRRKDWRGQPELLWFPDRDGRQFAWLPHTSGIVPWWNDPRNERRAAEFLRLLLEWTRRLAVA